MELALTLLLYVALVATAIAIIFMRRLFAVVILSGVFSLLCALLYIVMDAADVAFTEAAVGAGISTILMLGTIALTARSESLKFNPSKVPLGVVLLVGGVLIYGTWDMPNFGDPTAPVLTHVGPDYLARTPVEVDIPNVVTAVLATYRAFDTLGEVAVVFTAGLGVWLLLANGTGGATRRRGRHWVYPPQPVCGRGSPAP
ncbi:MAG: DUF4040 domain-containing protein, partial [Pseudomonadota bacterium]